MRTLLLANGSSLTTVDELPLEDAQNLYVALQAGLWGPFSHSRNVYLLLAQLHLNKEVAIAAASGKKYRPSEFPEFHKIFPDIEDYQSLGTGEVRRERKLAEQMAKKAALAIPMEGAPSWLKEAMSNG